MITKRKRFRVMATATAAAVLAGALAAVTTLALPRAARACGGFFCNAPPPGTTAPPIAQAGENVLFVLGRDPATGRGLVEAHVQIIYMGAADQFSWVVPVTSVPEVGVGTDLLFQIIEPRTRPSFQVQWQTEGTCKGSGGGDSTSGCASASSGAAGASPGRAVDGGASGPTVEVAFRGNVGPYETAVVRSDDPAALEAWLAEHAYFVSPEASQIIRGYVDTGSYFVALRLQSGRDVNEIQPIVLKLGAEEGCLPLKLTAVASVPNLRVNVWVLGEGRAVPLNYTEISLNFARVDWFTGGANYDRVVADAANDAGGNAFLTEYAQPASTATGWFAVPSGAITLITQSSSPLSFWSALQATGLPFTGKLLEILRKYLPMPASLAAQGVTEAQFYGSLPSYQFAVQQTSIDSRAAAAELQAQVFAPLDSLRLLFANHAHLTRLATYISPEEMTKDPLFMVNRTLPPVSNQHVATGRVKCGDEDYDSCSAPVELDVESRQPGSFRKVFYRPLAGRCGAPNAYDRGQIDAMPAADLGWRRDTIGEGDVVVDNGAAIAAAVGNHNAAANPDTGGCALAARTARRPWPVLLLAAAAWLLLRQRGRRAKRGCS